MEVRSTLRRLLARPTVRTAAIAGLGGLALTSLTYLGPDLLGRRIWKQTREKLEKQGEPITWETYLPRPVPDEQNIFKAPKIAEWFLRSPGSPNLYANANLYPTEWRIKLGIFDQTLRQITRHPVATVTLGDHNEADLTLRYQNDTFDPAPNLPPEEPVSIISFEDVPLRTAFEHLARHSGLTIQYDPSLILAWDATTNATKPTGIPISQGNIPRDPSIKGRWENKTVRAVIHRILETYGLGYQEEEPGTIRVLPQPVPTPAQKKIEALLAAAYQAHPQNYSVGLLTNIRGRTFASDNQTNNPITIAVVGPDKPTVAEIQKLFPPKLAPGGPGKKGGWEVELLGNNQFQVFYENNGNYSAQAYLALNDQSKTDWKFVSEGLALPAAHIDGDYHRPFEVVGPDYVAVRVTAQTLAERAQCHLLTGQPEAALEDLTCLHNLRRVMASQPTTLVAAMFDVAISGLHVNMVADGLPAQGVGRTPDQRPPSPAQRIEPPPDRPNGDAHPTRRGRWQFATPTPSGATIGERKCCAPGCPSSVAGRLWRADAA